MAAMHDRGVAAGGREVAAQNIPAAGACEATAYSREAAAILASRHPVPPMEEIGRSREGRPIRACRIGDGSFRVSLLAGCHADEPVGPRFLELLARHLSSPAGAGLRKTATWHLIPHLNPDGAARNAAWQTPGAAQYDFAAYLRHRIRELPGDDIEFGFPARPAGGSPPRPENLAAAAFWSEAGPFDLHASLHGMSFAAGPYFLLERSWWPRFTEAGPEGDAGLAGFLSAEAGRVGYVLHDVERNGEKGFHRLAPGFCSRPDSSAMRRHFLDRGEPDVAARFRPSSMEAVRALGGDPLTLVSEMPLFILPGVGETLGPPDPAMERWRMRIAEWDARLREAATERQVRREAAEAGLAPMPVADQMRFQWALIRAGLAAAGLDRQRPEPNLALVPFAT